MSYTSPNRNYQTEPNKPISTEANMQSTMLISQLKTKIFDLEQNMKNYENLQNKFKNLQNENTLLVQDKLRLEYQLKQKGDSSAKTITELQNEIEHVKSQLRDKMLLNKNLFNENENLHQQLEEKKNQIEAMMNEIKSKD